MLRMELPNPSYYSLIGETVEVTRDPDSHSNTVHNLFTSYECKMARGDALSTGAIER